MKKQSNFQFDSTDKKRWKECAKKEARGNLTLWVETQCNKAAEKILGKKKETEKEE